MAPSGPSSAGMSHGQPWEDTRSAKTINKRGRRRKSLRLWSLSRSGLRPNCRPVIFLLPRSGSRTLWDYRATGSSGISPGALQSQLAKWISLLLLRRTRLRFISSAPPPPPPPPQAENESPKGGKSIKSGNEEFGGRTEAAAAEWTVHLPCPGDDAEECGRVEDPRPPLRNSPRLPSAHFRHFLGHFQRLPRVNASHLGHLLLLLPVEDKEAPPPPKRFCCSRGAS